VSPFDIFVVGRDKDFKFGKWVDRSKWQTIPEGACSGHINYLNFGGHQPLNGFWTISSEWLELEWSNFACMYAMSSPSRMTNRRYKGRGQDNVIHFKFDAPMISLERLKIESCR